MGSRRAGSHWAAARITSSFPLPLLATVGITGTLRSRESLCTSISIPRFLAMSIMFRAMHTGTPISISWTVRYRLRSRLEASTMLTTMAGFSLTMKSLATTSSWE